MAEKVGILLRSDCPERKQGWIRALESLPCQILTDGGSRGEQAAVDVVVTDRALLADDDPPLGRRAAEGAVGVIALGAAGPADVSLSSDATDRELRLACLLLGQIVRLRRDRLEDHRLRQTLSHLALSDPVTGLANRRAYDEELARRLAALGSGSASVCLALIDLDRFKRVNDTQGHTAGDALLRQTGQALVASVRSHDFVCRLGGDEFAILISNLDPAAALRVVDRIRSCVTAAGPMAAPTASAGCVVATRGLPADTLFQAADQALMQAKKTGRNRAVQSSLESSDSAPTS